MRLGEEQRELAAPKTSSNSRVRDEVGIGRDDQPVDRVVLLHLRGEYAAGGRSSA